MTKTGMLMQRQASFSLQLFLLLSGLVKVSHMVWALITSLAIFHLSLPSNWCPWLCCNFEYLFQFFFNSQFWLQNVQGKLFSSSAKSYPSPTIPGPFTRARCENLCCVYLKTLNSPCMWQKSPAVSSLCLQMARLPSYWFQACSHSLVILLKNQWLCKCINELRLMISICSFRHCY